MPKSPYFRYILYMFLAVWGLWIFKAVDLKQAYSMSIGVLAGSLLGLILIRFIRKK